MITDDEEAIADLVAVYLTNDGYTVHKCVTGAQALACVEEYPIDLAILDVMLPDMDGFALCQRIREKHLFPILPPFVDLIDRLPVLCIVVRSQHTVLILCHQQPLRALFQSPVIPCKGVDGLQLRPDIFMFGQQRNRSVL